MALTAVATLLRQAPTITVHVDTKPTSWYTQPIWLAVGGVALVMVILIAVLAGRAGRGRGTEK
jgi:hypothetical protein